MASSARNSTDRELPEVDQRPTLSNLHSLSRAVHSRRAEYIRPQKIRIKIGSWNVAACPGTENDLAGWFLEGKGINKNLAGLRISDAITDNGSQENIESVGEQEARRRKKEPTIPAGDDGTIIGGEDIGLYVLGLQEVVDLTSTREYIGKIYADSGPTSKWRKALMDALPPGYEVVAEQQLSGLLLYVCASPAVAPTISNVSTVSVGTGIMGYLGNKGAVTTRIVLGDMTRMVFVNSHLASGSDPTHLERRCWDVRQILERTHFDPISWAGVLEDGQEGIGDEDFAFWFGDLNYRLDGLPGDDIRRLLLLHTRGEYDIGQKSRIKIDNELGDVDSPVMIHSIESDDDSSQDDDSNPRTSSTFDKYDDASSTTLPDPDDFIQDPSQDPGSLQATLDSLLPHDQLRHVMKKKKAFHDGWREGPITFLPTYKYDVGSMGMFDSSEKKRAPSWCDRILFRTRTDKKQHDEQQKQEEAAKRKDEEMKSRGMDHVGDDEDVLFDYNPEEDGDETPEAPVEEPTTTGKDFYDEYDEGEDSSPTDEVLTKEGFLDKIHLDLYISHQSVLSSDHKPLDAVFTLEYDAVDSELKSKVQQEVARELDRAENEGRPGITVVVDRSQEVDDVTTKETRDLSSRRPYTGSAEGINFGNVSFFKRKTRALTIANTSQVTSTFAFVDRPNESGDGDRIAPPWLTVSFAGSETDEDTHHQKKLEREVKLEPGDAVNCTLELFVDDIELVRSLNENSAEFDDVLVLRVTDGRDHFIPIRATWQQSCFGRSIDELIRIPEGGVRALVPRRKGEPGGLINRGQEVRWSAPRELFKLTEAVESLTERVNADAAMIENAQLPKESASWPFAPQSWLLKDTKTRERLKSHLLEALDADKNLIDSFPPEVPAIEKLEITSEILIVWLSCLKDGIVPIPLWTQLDTDISSRGAKQLTDVEETKAWVLDVLSASPNHNISFVFLTSMLARVVAELAPFPKVQPQSAQETTGNMRASLDSVRKIRALSWKGKAPTQSEADEEKKRAWRMQVEKAYVDVFAGVVFRTPSIPMSKAKERKIADERRKYVLEVFLHGGKGN
jgi:hypothetical protein